MFSRNNTFAVSNAMLQAGALLSVNQNILWPTYIVMGMMCYLAFLQTIGAAAFISKTNKTEIEPPPSDVISLRILVAAIYLMSVYSIYKLGYDFFAGFMLAHIIIYFLSSFMRLINDD